MEVRVLSWAPGDCFSQSDPGEVSRQLRLAFLALDIVAALLDGAAPARRLPVRWAAQRRLLGFPQP
ncbi:hypothetical protein [Amphiplicatus metriothermophilus]|uniref:hypothetical protein n=1 Tax=Amphiplicatus metriothermophilus TaxID=1519374 RepID=UPI0011786553|nr:hypothetical protein [Amphiplicatus metriothermophilus]